MRLLLTIEITSWNLSLTVVVSSTSARTLAKSDFDAMPPGMGRTSLYQWNNHFLTAAHKKTKLILFSAHSHRESQQLQNACSLDQLWPNINLLDEAGVYFQFVRELAFCGKTTTSWDEFVDGLVPRLLSAVEIVPGQVWVYLKLNVALEFVQDDLEFDFVVLRRPRPSIVNVPSMTADPQE